jgi:hypothetical protein
MECVPWKSFGRIIERHQGDKGVRVLAPAGPAAGRERGSGEAARALTAEKLSRTRGVKKTGAACACL